MEDQQDRASQHATSEDERVAHAKGEDNVLPDSLIRAAANKARRAEHHRLSITLEQLSDKAIHRQCSASDITELCTLVAQEYRQFIDALIELYPGHVHETVTAAIFEHRIAAFVRTRFEREASSLADMLGATESDKATFLPEILRLAPTAAIGGRAASGFGYSSLDLITSRPAWASSLQEMWARISSYLEDMCRDLENPAPGPTRNGSGVVPSSPKPDFSTSSWEQSLGFGSREAQQLPLQTEVQHATEYSDATRIQVQSMVSHGGKKGQNQLSRFAESEKKADQRSVRERPTVQFIERKGRTSIRGSWTPDQLLHTYDILWPLLQELRAEVMQIPLDGDQVSVPTVRKRYASTLLATAADDKDIEEFIDIFRKEDRATAKNAALVFLERKTGLTRGSLKTIFSRSRKRQINLG